MAKCLRFRMVRAAKMHFTFDGRERFSIVGKYAKKRRATRTGAAEDQ